MALENVTETVWSFPPELIGQVSLLITVLQALGGVIIIYLVFSIINMLLNKKKNKKIEEISLAVNNINQTLKDIRGAFYSNRR